MTAFNAVRSSLILNALILFIALAWGNSALAQVTLHTVLLDTDNNSSTGCSVSSAAGSVNGIELRLDAEVAGRPPEVTSVSRSACVGGSFGASTSLGGPFPIATDEGLNGADALELGLAFADVPPPTTDTWQVAFLSVTPDGGADLMGPAPVNVNGTPPPAGPTVPVPGLALPGLLVLAVLMAGLLVWNVRANPGLMSILFVSIGLSLFALAWAASFMVDGNLDDWAGETPDLTDPQGDSTSGEEQIDLLAGFVAAEAGNLYFRIDLDEAAPANTKPEALPASADTDDQNPVDIDLEGMDDDGDSLTFAIATPPPAGSLGAITQLTPTTARVTYTPATGEFGDQSFTFTVNDGNEDSDPQTVTLTVSPTCVQGPPTQVNYTTMGTFVAPFLYNSPPGITVTGSNAINVLNLNGLGIVGGLNNNTIDGAEWIEFSFDSPSNAVNTSYFVSSAGNQNGDGIVGAAFVEAFDEGGVSQGVVPVNGTGTFNMGTLFGPGLISYYRVTANVDNHRITAATAQETVVCGP